MSDLVDVDEKRKHEHAKTFINMMVTMKLVPKQFAPPLDDAEQCYTFLAQNGIEYVQQPGTTGKFWMLTDEETALGHVEKL